MSVTANPVRQELKGYIDAIPERSIEVARSFLSYLAETSVPETLVIEPADEEEIAMIEEGMREYESDPSSFRNWKDVKRDLGLG